MQNLIPEYSDNISSAKIAVEIRVLYATHNGRKRRIIDEYVPEFTKEYLLSSYLYGIAIPNLLPLDSTDVYLGCERELEIVSVGLTCKRRTPIALLYDPQLFKLIGITL